MRQKEEKYRLENPNATAYDMLMAGVITQKRFNELDSEIPVPQSQHVGPTLQKVVPTIVMTENIQPTLSEAPAQYRTNATGTRRVYLHDNKNGKATPMSIGSAQREQKKYPQRYTIQN